MTKEEAWALERTELEALEGGDLVEELIRRYRPLVYATARRLCPGLCRDEDLLQCGLIGLWRAAEQWDRERPFPPLARQCIRHEMADYLRQVRRQGKTVPLADWAEGLTYEQDFTQAELRAQAQRLFPAHSRERALVLAVLDGYTVAQAARAVGLRPRRAREKLRRGARRLLDEMPKL